MVVQQAGCACIPAPVLFMVASYEDRIQEIFGNEILKSLEPQVRVYERYASPDTVFFFEFLICLVSSNRYPCPDHAHEYKEKRKQEKLPRFALGRCRRQSLALLFSPGSPFGEEARFLRAKAS